MNAFNRDHYPKRTHEKEINLKEYVQVIKKRFWIIILITCMTTFAGYYFISSNNVPMYQTSTRIIVESNNDYMKTLMVMIKDPIIMEKVKDDLKLSRSSGQIANQIEVEQIDDSQVILVTVQDQNPSNAVRIANQTAQVFKKEVVTLLDFEDVQLLSEAQHNDEPINGTNGTKVVLFIVIGLVAGVGFTFLLESLDGSIKDEEEVEDILGVPILGTISNMNKKKLRHNKGRKHTHFEMEVKRRDLIGMEKSERGSTIEAAESNHLFKQ